MAVAWRAGTGTAREVHERMTGRRRRAYTTIMTTMDRLFRKGILTRKKVGLAWRYSPAFTEEAFDHALAVAKATALLAHGPHALAAFVDAVAGQDPEALDRLATLVAARRRRARQARGA